MVYEQKLVNLVQDYGYFNGWLDPDKAVGRSSEMVEFMAILPKPGKKEELKKAAQELNIFLKEDKKSFGSGKPAQEVLTFASQNQPEFKQIIRKIVKEANIK